MALKQISIMFDDEKQMIIETESRISYANEHELPLDAPLNLSSVWQIDEKTNQASMRWEIVREPELRN